MTGRQILMVATFVGIPSLVVGLAWCRARIIERGRPAIDEEGADHA